MLSPGITVYGYTYALSHGVSPSLSLYLPAMYLNIASLLSCVSSCLNVVDIVQGHYSSFSFALSWHVILSQLVLMLLTLQDFLLLLLFLHYKFVLCFSELSSLTLTLYRSSLFCLPSLDGTVVFLSASVPAGMATLLSFLFTLVRLFRADTCEAMLGLPARSLNNSVV